MENPHNLAEVRVQGASKIMARDGFVDGRFLPIHWFEGLVNGNSYNILLKEKVWPSVRSKALTVNSLFLSKRQFLGQSSEHQDSRLTFPGPDLNPLDFYFWDVADKRSL